ARLPPEFEGSALHRREVWLAGDWLKHLPSSDQQKSSRPYEGREPLAPAVPPRFALGALMTGRCDVTQTHEPASLVTRDGSDQAYSRWLSSRRVSARQLRNDFRKGRGTRSHHPRAL